VPGPQVAELRSPSRPLQLPQQQAQAKQSWAQDMLGYPNGGNPATARANIIGNADITGSSAAKPAAKKEEKEPPVPQAPESIAARGTPVQLDQQRPTSAGERALLERLQERRQELDARARELDLRESMLKAAEKKLETQNAVEKAEEAGAGGGGGGAKTRPMAQRQEKEELESTRFKSVVTMYETMKPKEAAKIFDRLDIGVLLDMASQIKPQIMAAILAQMSPEVAERLTVELAAKTGSDRSVNPSKLPKIDGRPGGT